MLNLPRLRLQQAGAVMRGIGFALTKNPLPFDLFDALTDDAAEAKRQHEAANQSRAVAKARQKAGWGR